MRLLLKPKRKFSMSFSVAFASVKSLVSMYPGDFVRNFVNRDLLYKPVVLGCGHISCFWCVFRAMDLCLVSHCPVCRHPYNHFPSICQLLHFLLLKLYPIAYKRREQQVIAEEKILDQFSPQLDNCLSGSEPIKEPYIHSGVPPHSTTSSCNNVSLGPCSMVEGESESTIAPHKNDKMPIPAKSTFEATKNVPFGQTGMLGDKFNKQQNSKLVLIADFLCSICKKLLYRPVVLNCGHVYCETCIISPDDKVPVCQVCLSVHPNGNPKVCLVLKHFLEEQFSEQYALRKEATSKQSASQNGSPPAYAKTARREWALTSVKTAIIVPPSFRAALISSTHQITHSRLYCQCTELIKYILRSRLNSLKRMNLMLQRIWKKFHLPPILPGDSPHDPEDGLADPRF
ncbi:hypothetical protein TEA_010037 [Camellia sinensis var. sinensis]|uniref:RING-type domain-containing protein n=1 Tax=Camellia sinensis var. sinensis TaxID=542762 RepID=A0A4S4DFT9_CAMSN|nr:hypothetical protein TEA_010037 [Camellia sinensis var. sinensis]